MQQIQLLTTLRAAEIRDLIDYSIEQAPKTKYDMRFFGAIKRYVPEWSSNKAREKERTQQAQAVKDCPLCNEAGYLELRHKEPVAEFERQLSCIKI